MNPTVYPLTRAEDEFLRFLLNEIEEMELPENLYDFPVHIASGL